MHFKPNFLATIGMLITCAAPALCADAPVTQPVLVDLSTPKSAIRSMFTAVEAADAPALRETFRVEGPEQQDLISAYADVVVAGRRLREAARDKFADPAAPPPAPETTPRGPSPEDAAKLAAADVQVAGETATVRLPGRPNPIKLKRDGDRWRIDLADYAGATAKQLAEQAEVNHALAAAMEEAADEINTGKYASAQEAESAVQQKIHAVIAKQLKSLTTRPATQPSTAPAASTAP